MYWAWAHCPSFIHQQRRNTMSCHDNSCDTGKGSCDTENKKSDDCCTLAEDVYCLAECAKHELLKEKMKKLFEARIGKKLDKVAEIAVDALIGCLDHELAGKQACNKYKEDLFAALKG